MLRYALSLLLLICMLNAGLADLPDNFQKENLVAWCIVPFDGKKRGPEERAAMCADLGLKRIAYDWRQNHVAEFEREIQAYQKHGLEYFAFWSVHDKAFELFEKYDLHPQIWITLSSPNEPTQSEKVAAAVKSLLPLVERTRKLGCQLGLYNHGGWGGEPENLVAVCRALREDHNADHVGIVYNFHHAHSRIDDFHDVLKVLQPYLLCLNLNGMKPNGDQQGQKILPLGAGDCEQQMIQQIIEAGYSGPIGIIGHTQDDVEQRLQDNLDGLKWIETRLSGEKSAVRPEYRTWKPAN